MCIAFHSLDIHLIANRTLLFLFYENSTNSHINNNVALQGFIHSYLGTRYKAFGESNEFQKELLILDKQVLL